MAAPLTDPVHAGFAAADLTPETGVPLGGYGGAARRCDPVSARRQSRYATFFRPSTGVLDPIRAKAVVLRQGCRRLLFLSLDVVGVTTGLRRELSAALRPSGFDTDAIFVCATHTHSGPGTLSRNLLWQALAMDLFQPEIHARFLAGVLDTVHEAAAAAEPVSLRTVSFDVPGLQQNRRDRSHVCDTTANMLLATSATTGRCLGAMVNLAIHGTALPQENHEFSADVPGGIERALEACLGAPVLFVNGAEGDVSPLLRGRHGVDLAGRIFAEHAMAALPNARAIEPHWAVAGRRVVLARPRLAARAFLRRDVPLSLVRIGDIVFAAWPGEPTTRLGLAVKQAARAAGAAQSWMLGLTNGYFGYFLAADEYRAGGYEAASCLYGPSAGAALVDAFASLLRES